MFPNLAQCLIQFLVYYEKKKYLSNSRLRINFQEPFTKIPRLDFPTKAIVFWTKWLWSHLAFPPHWNWVVPFQRYRDREREREEEAHFKAFANRFIKSPACGPPINSIQERERKEGKEGGILLLLQLQLHCNRGVCCRSRWMVWTYLGTIICGKFIICLLSLLAREGVSVRGIESLGHCNGHRGGAAGRRNMKRHVYLSA